MSDKRYKWFQEIATGRVFREVSDYKGSGVRRVYPHEWSKFGLADPNERAVETATSTPEVETADVKRVTKSGRPDRRYKLKLSEQGGDE